MNPIRTLLTATLLTAFLAAPAIAKEKRIIHDPVKPAKGKQSLTWNINKRVKRLKIRVLDHKCIVNTVKAIGGQEITVGKYIEPGKNHEWEYSFKSPTNIGQLRVNVDKAENSQIRLFVIYDE